MTTSYLEYELQNGFIHNWLVAGPQIVPIQAPQTVTAADFRVIAAQKLFEEGSGVQTTPAEPGPLAGGVFTLAGYETTWAYTACGEDHMIQRSTQCPGWNYLRTWAYTQLHSNADQEVTLTLTAYGPVDLWLNDRPVFHGELFAERVPQPQQAAIRLHAGENELVARFTNVATFHCPLALAVHVGLTTEPLIVRIPTADGSPERSREIEDDESNNRVFNPQGMPTAPFHDAPPGDIETRRGELIRYAAGLENSLYAQMARIAGGDWKNVDLEVILNAVRSIAGGEEGSVIALASLLNLLAHLDESASLPDAVTTALEPALAQAALGYAYAPTPETRMDFDTESRAILFHACEITAGQRYADRVFADGKTGQEHRAHGEEFALPWMRERGKTGFSTWESPAVYAETLPALALLIDAAESEPIWELASVLMDKILFALSLYNFQGVFSSARCRANSQAQRSGLMDETAGITYLLWGIGTYNPHLAAPVNLALLKNYELPPIFEQIAGSIETVWSRERQAGKDGEANLMSYRTMDYMLSSVQDYRKGEVGDQEQLWRATLSPDAVVFTNHPGACQDDGPRPGFWAGSRSLPRIAQWKDILIAIYNLPVEPAPVGGLPFTHAYFPTSSFDTYVIRDNWAFARKENGYLALTASRPMTLTTSGPHALQELRVDGGEVVWVCQMGAAAQYGGFSAFQEKVLALSISFSSLAASLTNLRGEQLAFAWDGKFTMNDLPLKITGFPQYDNLYCVSPFGGEIMEIHTNDYYLGLSFEEE